MHGQIKRRDVEWERASCRGLDTNLFYLMRTDLLEEGLGYNNLRRICFECPIMKECLQIGTSLERYGFWGGLSEEERTAIYENRDGKIIYRLRRDLQMLGIRYQPLADIVLSVKRVFGEFDYTGRMIIERPDKSG
jgi:WhiB family transcriptional regulator, redox-sensing transcriptional regulator